MVCRTHGHVLDGIIIIMNYAGLDPIACPFQKPPDVVICDLSIFSSGVRGLFAHSVCIVVPASLFCPSSFRTCCRRRRQWLSHLLRIRVVPSSELGPETGYPKVFRGFTQSPGKCRDSILNYTTTVYFHRLSNSFDATDSVVK
jgi:hypothetical protein